MSKRTRTLLLAGIAVVVLAALLVVLLLLPQPEEDTGDDDTAAVDTSVTLLDKAGESEDDAVTLSAVTITYGGATYSLTADEDGTLLTDSYKDLPHDSAAQSELSTELETVVVDKLVVEAPENPADFGFDGENGEMAAVSATYADGSTFAFELGNEAPSGEGVYLRETGKDAIYLYDTYSAEVFKQKETAYLSKSPITAPTAEDTDEAAEDTLIIRDAELTGSVREEKISFQVAKGKLNSAGLTTSVSGFMIQKPYYRGVHSETSLIQAASFSALTASDIAKVYPTAADLASCGMNDPYSACTFNLAIQRPVTETDEEGNETTTYTYYNVFEYTVKLGNLNEGGLRYMVVYSEENLIPIIYLVDEDNVIWANTQYDDVADPLLFYVYIGDIGRMTFTVNGVTTAFELEHIADETDSDKNMVVTAGDKTYDTADFRTLYQDAMAILRSGTAEKEPTGDPVLTLKMEPCTDGVSGEDLAIYPYSAAKYLVRHATGETYLVDSKDVESFLSKYSKYLAQ